MPHFAETGSGQTQGKHSKKRAAFSDRKPPNRAMAAGWANDLQLGGYLKPGSPGIFVFEGEAAACDEFIKQLKAVPNSCLRYFRKLSVFCQRGA